jgi:predicted solute-binding protein
MTRTGEAAMTEHTTSTFEKLVREYDAALEAGDDTSMSALGEQLADLDEGWWFQVASPPGEPVPPGISPYSAWDGWG